MKSKSRLYIFGLIIVLVVLVSIGGFFYLSYDKSNKGKKLTLEKSDFYEGNTKKRANNSGVFILTDNIKKYKGTYCSFTTVGYDVLSGDFKEYEKNIGYEGAFIFPEKESNSLSDNEVQKIKKNIEKGQRVIVIGKSKLSSSLGVEISYDKKVNSYVMKGHEKQKIEIKDGMDGYQYKVPKEFQSLAINSVDKTPVLSVANIGKGKVIYSGSELAPEDGSGYENYPFLLDAFSKEFKLTPVFSRNNGGIYLDIGYHMGVETPAEVAEKAKKWGYDQINVGVWASMTKDNVDYYKGIVEESHKRGIKVFAWFELPMVGVDFWNNNPQWRQKTAAGKDAQIDWRYLMALENKDCFNAAKNVVKDVMNKFEFDGIDIAEIYYESPGKGFTDENIFTPMNDSFREIFKKKHGFDPKLIFDSTSDYFWRGNEDAKNKIIEERANLIIDQHKEMLNLANELKKNKPYLETSVTMIDSIADNRMKVNIGLDANKIVNLQKEYNFILNIEDPFTLWSLGPERYSVIGESYRNLMDKKDRLSIDINIIERYGQNYPTKKQRGVEVYSLIHNASKYTNKVVMYALATLEKEDMDLAPYAYAYDVKSSKIAKNTYEFEGKHNFIWHIDMKSKEVYVDGKKYPVFMDDKIIVPYGKHKVEIKDTKNNLIRVNDINCEIISAEYIKGSANIKYNSHGRCFINLSKKPTSIKLNGKTIKPEIKEINGTYTIMLPKGENTVVIE